MTITTMRMKTSRPVKTLMPQMNCLNWPSSSSQVVTSSFWPVQSSLGTVWKSFM